MFKYALLATCSFALGVLVRDVAQDYRDAKVLPEWAACQADRENAALYARALVALLNGERVSIPGAVMSCKTQQVKS